jgi:hypothetical protein
MHKTIFFRPVIIVNRKYKLVELYYMQGSNPDVFTTLFITMIYPEPA